jgi:myosin heavy subunit
VRHALDFVYTLSGDVLLAVNPWKQLPIYSPQAINTYQIHSDGNTSAKLPPHIFSSTAAALRRMARGSRTQSIIVRCVGSAGGVLHVVVIIVIPLLPPLFSLSS